MGLLNHVDIIGAVANRQCQLLGIVLLNQINNVCLLLGGDTTGQHHIALIS